MPAKRSLNPKDLSFPKILDESDDTSKFSCGKKEIDEFIQKQALSFQAQSLGVTYLFHQGADLVGFATLCMGHINKHKIASQDRLTQQVNSYPALLIGQLAVCEAHQGEGVGTYICDFCFDRAIRLSQRVGCRFLVVDALESAVEFYLKIGVWIAEEFNEQHLSALAYLNENMNAEGPSFFGIKIELKKIGNSLPAPELVVLVKPNSFQRNLSREVESESDRKRHALRVEFFSKLADAYKILNPSWNKVKAQPQHWLSFGAGRSGFSNSWSFRARNGWRFAIELYIDQQDQEDNKRALKELGQMRPQIEQELGFSLDFQELPERRACRIEVSKQTSGPITKLSDDEMKELIQWGLRKNDEIH